MSTLITEVYEAFLESGASENKAKAAAEALASYENRFSTLEAGQMLLKWMVGFNLAFTNGQGVRPYDSRRAVVKPSVLSGSVSIDIIIEPGLNKGRDW